MNKKRTIKYSLRIFTGIILLWVISVNAQQKTNLDVFNELIDSSVTRAVSFIPENVKNIKFELNNGSFAVFNSEIISAFSNRGFNLVSESNSFEIQYFINNAVTSYGEIYRDGFLGDYFVPRKIILSGGYNFSGRSIFTKDFSYSFLDTVNVDSVGAIENSVYPFTQAKLPSEPFFSNILEPVIAVGTAALAVILFFTIRSK